MRRGGGGGRGAGRVGNGRRDERPGGARDDRGRRDRRPDYRPRRSPRRSPSPDHRPRRSPRCSPSPDHRARRPRDDDGGRGLPRRGPMDYDRVPYRQERDRYDHPGRDDRGPRRSHDGRDDRGLNGRSGASGRYNSRGASGRYDAPPDYMLPEHPSDLGQSSPRAVKKESDFFGGPSGRSINKEKDFLGDGDMTIRVSATGLGRTSSLYMDRRSPLPQPPPGSPPPRPLYPSGFLTGGSTMNAMETVGTGSTRLLHNDSEFQYRDRLRGPYVGNRELERLYPGRDVPADRDGEIDRLYSSRNVLGSDIAPSTQSKVYAGSSSSVLAKDHPYRVHGEHAYEPSNGYAMDDHGRPSHDSLGHGSGQAHRFSESSLEHGSGNDDKILLEITRQAHFKHPPRTALIDYDAHEYGRRDPEKDTHVASDNIYGNGSRDLRVSLRRTLGSPLTDLKDERIDRQIRISRRVAEDRDDFQGTQHDMEQNLQHSYHGDAPTRYRNRRSVHMRYSNSPETEPLELARRLVHQHEFASFEDGHELSDQEVSPLAYRRRNHSAAYHDHDDSPPERKYYDDEMDACDPSPERMSRSHDVDACDLSYERMSRRSYDLVDDEDGFDARYDMPPSHNVFSRIALPNDNNDKWIDADQGNHPHPYMLAYGRLKYKPISQRLSGPMVQSQFRGSVMHGRGRGGWPKSAKKRLRPALPQFHGGYISERNEFLRPNKMSKLSEENHNSTELNHEDAPEDEDLPVQKDPPEGSEEFSKQVHEAFLKFAKILNESPTMQKSYREAPKGSLSCCVCGSVARKFLDIDALMSHVYNTCKVGLKTKHLGLHKALCVLMGWNWHVAPDTSKGHHSIPDEEVNAMKGDLMLWPPVVVIHNSSIRNKAKVPEAKIVSKEEIEGVLADIGVACDKAKVTHGRPANQSVFLVKFLPTISGFQEAMRIHEHFTAENRGKEEFQQIKGGKGKSAAPVDKLEEVLYGHIAVAEDLGYLDNETKKRCVVRSKNDIEAKADATLNLDS